MPEPIIQTPDPTLQADKSAGMLNDTLRAQLQAAYEARANEDGARLQGLTSPNPPPAPRDEAGKFTTRAVTPPPAIATTDLRPNVAPAPKPAETTKPGPVAGKDYPASAKAWDEWKTKAREDLRKELETEFTSKPPAEVLTLKQQLDAIAKERDEARGHLRQVAIERDPAFEKEYKLAVNAAIGMAKTVVGIANADAVEKVLNMQPGEYRDAAVDKLMENLPAYKQSQIGMALGRMDEIRATKAAKIADTQANWQKYQQEQQLVQERQQAEATTLFEQQLQDWSGDKGLAVLQKRDGDTEWNDKVDKTAELAREIFSGNLNSPKDVAKAAIWAASAPALLDELKIALGRIKELEGGQTQDAQLQPGARGDGGGALQTKGQVEDEQYSKMNYGQALAAKIREAGIAMPNQ